MDDTGNGASNADVTNIDVGWVIVGMESEDDASSIELAEEFTNKIVLSNIYCLSRGSLVAGFRVRATLMESYSNVVPAIS